MAAEISRFKFSKTKFNLVRFNPHPSSNYTEPPVEKLNEIYNIIKSVCNYNQITTNKSRIVPRIGQDVYASCGMFFEDEF